MRAQIPYLNPGFRVSRAVGRLPPVGDLPKFFKAVRSNDNGVDGCWLRVGWLASVPPLTVTRSAAIGVADGINDAVATVAVAVALLPTTAVRGDFLVGVLAEVGV